jgi:hypothetical protein
MLALLILLSIWWLLVAEVVAQLHLAVVGLEVY